MSTALASKRRFDAVDASPPSSPSGSAGGFGVASHYQHNSSPTLGRRLGMMTAAATTMPAALPYGIDDVSSSMLGHSLPHTSTHMPQGPLGGGMALTSSASSLAMASAAASPLFRQASSQYLSSSSSPAAAGQAPHQQLSKRSRQMDGSNNGPVSPMFASMQLISRRSHDSAFASSTSSDPVDKYIAGSKRVRNHIQEDASVMRPPPEEEQQYFTLSEVKSILERALEDRENQLRAEYDITLQQKLSEQFNSFSKFNEDHIHRQLKESTWSYMS
ncbi:hypothetical protein CAOG_01891 [Capsaspora owczarzaki ATCC 30864]|uniref:Akirin n=1 Tax=Capsaspora owczarzaki (strain ATCC 30864) TaxID=595528 RepID=A0A0D2VKP0_CAPO3|nr:hypothetical protein CAOG_01891 [Capsaspora owczarzaki ATCC 30864]KJE90597.1 hypothetical protein CAOG_001891 [Capsaspora owczarzaki ATCC 30864]|eukprot:XP_004364759.1 hypothetical protein CAOG_01891 [Capsaspora owczarzaki ATCC 30864]